MPMYLTRWPDGSLSLTQAQNRRDLMELLDMEGSAAGCRVRPLTSSFSLSIQPPTKLENEMDFEIDFSNADSGNMLRFALEAFWPNLKALVDRSWNEDRDDAVITDNEFRTARERDLELKTGEPKLKHSFTATNPEYVQGFEETKWLAVVPEDLIF
jgi:hypothetical protein